MIKENGMESAEFNPLLIETLRSAKHIVVFTGSGVSAESGIPTFRDEQTGLWSNFNPEDLATARAFRANPTLVWEWYEWRKAQIAKSSPNPAHTAIVQMQKIAPAFTLVTQNIDNLHQRAGSLDVIELHGNIFRTKCFACGRQAQNQEESLEIPPRCQHCNGRLRPDVVWFGEPLSHDSYSRSKNAVRLCDVLFSIGTSSKIFPAAVLPFEAAARGKTVIQINPGDTDLDDKATYNFKCKAGEILPILVKLVWPGCAD